MAESPDTTNLSGFLADLKAGKLDPDILPLCPKNGLPVYAEPSQGCFVHVVQDKVHSPFLVRGDRVVIDPAETEIRSGELYIIRSDQRHELVQIRQAPKSLCVRLSALNPEYQVCSADSVILRNRLEKHIVGRVIGILRNRAAVAQPVTNGRVL